VLYADSDHGYDHVIDELRTWGWFEPKIIFVHDTKGFDGEVIRAAQKYAQEQRKQCFNFDYAYGWAVIV